MNLGRAHGQVSVDYHTKVPQMDSYTPEFTIRVSENGNKHVLLRKGEPVAGAQHYTKSCDDDKIDMWEIHCEQLWRDGYVEVHDVADLAGKDVVHSILWGIARTIKAKEGDI